VDALSREGCLRWVGLSLAVLGAIGTPQAGAEFVEYPQFRHSSGLPGNGYVVNAEGNVGWEGAMSQCIPLGYTPSDGSVAVSYFSGSRFGGLELGFTGNHVDGTFATTIGFGSRGHGMSFTTDFVDASFHVAMHGQAQVVRETHSRPAISVGVLDWENRREATHFERDRRGARSLFIAATKQFETGGRPLHVTVGLGTNRFGDGPFLGACYDVHDRVKVLAEYDGLGVNVATAAQLLHQKRTSSASQDTSTRDDALSLFFGVSDLKYPVLGLTYARKDVF